jgi:uncharacterized membrane protein YbjE (DUF340 family)
MPFEKKSSRLFVLIAGTVVLVGVLIGAFILDRLDSGVVITVCSGWFVSLVGYILGKSHQNGQVGAAREIARSAEAEYHDNRGN